MANDHPNPTTFPLSIPWDKVQVAYQRRLDELVAQAEIKGFRKGKAPRGLVEEKVGKKAIYGDVIEKVLPPAYQEAVKKRQLKPIIAPRVKPIKLGGEKPWKFEITVLEKPQVELKDYEKQLKDALAPTKIIKPGEKDQNQTVKQNQKLKLAFDTLLKVVEVKLPQMLVDEEVNIQLTKLLDQVRSLGMTIEQYLRAKNLTHQQLRADYEKTAQNMLKLNLALDSVAQEKRFEGKDRIAKAVNYLISL